MITKIQGHKTFFSTGNGQLKDSQKNVIFLHGAGMDHTVFVMPSRYFARHNFNVYAFDESETAINSANKLFYHRNIIYEVNNLINIKFKQKK